MIKNILLTLVNEKDSELEACEILDLMAKKMNFLPETVDEMRLAFIEALINAKEHAAKANPEAVKDVMAAIGCDAESITLKVRDTGQGFDPTLVEKPDIKKKLKSAHKRGWGLMLMEKLMDGMEISSFPPSGTLISMVKKRLKADPESCDIVREKKHIERLKYILSSFIDLSSFLCQNRDLESGLRSMLRILLGTLGISRGAIYTLDPGRECLQCAVDIKVKAREKLPVIKLAPDETQQLFVQEACEITPILTRIFPYFSEAFTKDEIQFVYSLRAGPDMLGLLMLGPRFGPSEGESEDQELLATLSRNISSAINTFRLMEQLKNANAELDQKVLELDTVREASQQISSVLEIENLPHVVENIFRNDMKIGKFSIALLEPCENRYNICHTGRELPETLDLWSSPVSRYVIQKMEPLFVADVQNEKRFQFHRIGNYQGNSFIVIPIVGQDEVIGLVSITDRIDGLPLTEKEFNLAQLLCSQLKIAVRNANLYKLGITDGLTHLYTLNYFKMRLAQEIARLRRVKSNMGVIVFDIQNFKAINEEHGIRAGDLVLTKIANFIKRQIRFNDIPCRLGGEKFGIIIPDTDAEGVKMVIGKLMSIISENKVVYNGTEILFACSFAANMYDVRQSLEQFVDLTDRKLVESKKLGPNAVVGPD
jgi:diguanylate cyclase (GGDEF)-like protein